MTNAACDIVLARLGENELPKRLLLPTAGDAHAARAEEYAADLARFAGGSLTLLAVVDPLAPDETVQKEEERLAENVERLRVTAGLADVQARVVRHRSIVACILEVGRDYDGIVMGAAGQGFSSQLLFRTVPEQIARHFKGAILVVKRHNLVEALVKRVMTE